ncbi:hypothetical protein TanjilG_09210 [Lupinus angustifolius]|uniref:Uncharacterized protein n=1 Tax=Lupinus angustifolius TaxID=3871 RepID=A0A4P1QWN7_LUPAN|nr:PREDICTED: uncharacterized protein LOC109327461 [Lupinus angustifolius]OIV96668.1 hypothetical protein TanjilG_09210 [Lupinus angustifolius]
MNRNGYREEKPCCYFHPKQVVIGVCPLCLNERLLILAAKQGQHHHHHNSASKASSHRLQSSTQRKQHTSIHKIFAFSSLFSSRQWKSQKLDYDVSPTLEDSFISMKFEENGVASWKKSTVSNKVSYNSKKESKSVIEHENSHDTFRWRKRIGHMFQLIRWNNRTSGVCHVAGKVEGVKVKKGNWMKTLTKRKTKESRRSS